MTEWQESSIPTGSMEYRSIVYNAARDGNLRRLKVFLESREQPEVENILSAKNLGTPALVIAARNGHLAVVKYLIGKRASVDVTGTVTFDGETIEGAPPLWAAAAAGHIHVVNVLVEAGANVNQRTATNSTPLRGACFDGHLEIVKFLVSKGADIEVANRHGHTCLMIAAFRRQPHVVRYLLSIGADVNKSSIKGNTALHDAAETGSLEILELLLEAGAMMRKDTYGLTPLVSAASLGHEDVVEFLVAHPQCFWREQIEALQLAGATAVDKRRDLGLAVAYWRRALTLLERGPSEEEAASAASAEAEESAWEWCEAGSSAETPSPAYNNQLEMRSLKDLEERIGDPDQLRMQALLIRERILGPGHADTVYYLRYRGAIYADVGRFDRCIQLWMHALNMQQKSMEPLCTMTQSTIVSFAELFAYILNEQVSEGRGQAPPTFADIHAVIRIGVEEIRRGLEDDKELETEVNHAHGTRDLQESFHRLAVAILHLVCLISRAHPKRAPSEDAALRGSLYSLVRLDPRDEKGQSLLHLASTSDTSTMGRFPVCLFPALPVVKLLLESGAEPCAVDNQGRTPLHLLLEETSENQELILTKLLESGAHIDQRCHKGTTPLQLMASKTGLKVKRLQFRSLQCMAAQTVRMHKLPYRTILPRSMLHFVEMH